MPMENKELIGATQINLSKNTPMDTAHLLQNSLSNIISMIIKGAKNARRY